MNETTPELIELAERRHSSLIDSIQSRVVRRVEALRQARGPKLEQTVMGLISDIIVITRAELARDKAINAAMALETEPVKHRVPRRRARTTR